MLIKNTHSLVRPSAQLRPNSFLSITCFVSCHRNPSAFLLLGEADGDQWWLRRAPRTAGPWGRLPVSTFFLRPEEGRAHGAQPGTLPESWNQHHQPSRPGSLPNPVSQ